MEIKNDLRTGGVTLRLDRFELDLVLDGLKGFRTGRSDPSTRQLAAALATQLMAAGRAAEESAWLA